MTLLLEWVLGSLFAVAAVYVALLELMYFGTGWHERHLLKRETNTTPDF